MTSLSLTVFKKANRQARLAIFCMQKSRTSETRTTTGGYYSQPINNKTFGSI